MLRNESVMFVLLKFHANSISKAAKLSYQVKKNKCKLHL